MASWMEDAKMRVCLTEAWQKVKEEFDQKLLAIIDKKTSSFEIQALYSQLGHAFVEKYRPNEERLFLLQEPYLSRDLLEEILRSCQSEINHATIEYLEEKPASFDDLEQVFQQELESSMTRAIVQSQQLLSESIETNNECNFESDEQKSDWLHAKSFAQVVSQGIVSLSYPGINAAPFPPQVLEKLFGHSLPDALRKKIWGYHLTKDIKQNCRNIARTISRNTAIEGITDPNVSPIFGMLQKSVCQVYLECFPRFSTPNRIKVTEKILNQYFIYAGQHHACYVPLVCSLVINFDHLIDQSNEYSSDCNDWIIHEFIHMLDQLLHEIPGGVKRDGCKEYALNVWRQVEVRDSDLTNHITSVFQRSTELISYVHPSSVIESWVEFIMLSDFRYQLAWFVWDQCFIAGDWNTLDSFLFAALQLLRGKLLAATTISQFKTICTESTVDITTASLREIIGDAREISN